MKKGADTPSVGKLRARVRGSPAPLRTAERKGRTKPKEDADVSEGGTAADADEELVLTALGFRAEGEVSGDLRVPLYPPASAGAVQRLRHRPFGQ